MPASLLPQRPPRLMRGVRWLDEVAGRAEVSMKTRQIGALAFAVLAMTVLIQGLPEAEVIAYAIAPSSIAPAGIVSHTTVVYACSYVPRPTAG